MFSLIAVAVVVSAVDTAEATEMSFEERIAMERREAIEEEMKEVSKKLRRVRTVTEKRKMLPQLAGLAQAAERECKYDVALFAYQQLIPLIRGPNCGLSEYLAWKLKDVKSKASQFKRLKPGTARMGEFLCMRGDWEAGLPLLAKDSKYESVVEREIQDLPLMSEDKLQLADDWCAIKTKVAYRRAGFWYKTVLQELPGDEATELEKRLYSLQSRINWWGTPGRPVELEDVASCSFSGFDGSSGKSSLLLTGNKHGNREGWRLHYGRSVKYQVRNGRFGVWGIDVPSQTCRMYIGGSQVGLGENYSSWIDCRVGAYKGRYLLYDVHVRYTLFGSGVVIEGPWEDKKFIGTNWVRR